MPALFASGHLPPHPRPEREGSRSNCLDLTRDGLSSTTLIPDVDYGREIRSVKHKMRSKVKKVSVATGSRQAFDAARRFVVRARVAADDIDRVTVHRERACAIAGAFEEPRVLDERRREDDRGRRRLPRDDFFEELARARRIAASLDDARVPIARDDIRRGQRDRAREHRVGLVERAPLECAVSLQRQTVRLDLHSRGRAAELKLRARACAHRLARTHRDHGLQLVDGAIGFVHRVELRRQAQTRADFGGASLRGELAGMRAVEELLPRRRACRRVVLVGAPGFRDALQKQRIGRIAGIQPLEEL